MLLTIEQARDLALERNRPDIADLVIYVSIVDHAQLVDESILDEPHDVVAPYLTALREQVEREQPALDLVLARLSAAFHS